MYTYLFYIENCIIDMYDYAHINKPSVTYSYSHEYECVTLRCMYVGFSMYLGPPLKIGAKVQNTHFTFSLVRPCVLARYSAFL